MEFKTVNGLMKHLRDTGININGSKEKRQLINSGYFHGYKGYRFLGTSNNRIPYTEYKDINATIEYDSQLKAAIYGRMMYIETALKNVALNCVMDMAKSERVQDVYDRLFSSYNNSPQNLSHKDKQEIQRNKLSIVSSITKEIFNAYKNNNPKITHYINSGRDIPLWAVFEILMMGDFGHFLAGLNFTTRDALDKELGINVAFDTNRNFVFKFIYVLKDLRNAVAHNGVVFDARFRNYTLSGSAIRYLSKEIGLPYLNFKTLGDYVVMMVFIMKLLGVTKTDCRAFVRDIEKIIDEYESRVDSVVFAKVVHPDTRSRLVTLKNYI